MGTPEDALRPSANTVMLSLDRAKAALLRKGDMEAPLCRRLRDTVGSDRRS
jgi:hypothetical protein